jgi:hypothetical protein
MRHLNLPLGVFVDGQGVDHPDGVAVAQPLQLGDDLAVEVRVVEAQDDELHRSDGHTFCPFRSADPIGPHRCIPDWRNRGS